jgi:hypothetical protein
MSHADLDGELKPLRDALRALPQVAPERSAWPQLAAQLAAQSRGASVRATTRAARWFVPAALAAAAMLAVGAHWLRQPGSSGIAATVPAAAASIGTNASNSTTSTNPQLGSTDNDAARQLAALQRRSQDLERWLRETRDAGGPLHGQDLAAATEIEDMIGLVDGQLNAASRDSELPLWRRRVALLEDLTVLRYSIYKVAETGVAQR